MSDKRLQEKYDEACQVLESVRASLELVGENFDRADAALTAALAIIQRDRATAAEVITQALCSAWPVEIGSDLVFAEQVGHVAAAALDAHHAEDCSHLADVLAGRTRGPHDDSACGWCARHRSGVPGENGDTWCCAKCKKLAEEGL